MATTTPKPAPLVTKIVNAASDLTGDVSPGEILVITGSFLAQSDIGFQLGSNQTLATQLGDTTVMFDEIQAPLIAVSAGQVTAIAPYEIDGRASVSLKVQNKGQSSAPVSLAVVATAPGIFQAKTIGPSYLTILNGDLSVNSAAKPAAKYSPITIFATGEGILTPAVQTGSIATPTGDAFSKPASAVSLTIGGQAAQVLYAGQGPGLFSGVLQVQATIPAASASGPEPLVLTIGNADTKLQTITVFIT